MGTPTTTYIQGPQGRLFVEDGGSGPAVPVLLIHGNGANLEQWRAQLDHLRRTRRAIAFDLRGFGKSDQPANGDYSLNAMVQDIDAVMDSLEIPRFVIVGHSYGGYVVAAYASARPERVAGLVFVDAAGTMKITDDEANAFYDSLRQNKSGVSRQWFAKILEEARDEVRAAVFASVDRTPAEVMIRALDDTRSFDMKQALERYHGPKLAIMATSTESPISIHVQFPEIPLHKMEGVSHWLMMDKPEEFNRLLDEFLAQSLSPEGRGIAG